MTLPTHSTNDMVWTDVNRMNTLNAYQANKKKEKHICPLQLDIIDRLIDEWEVSPQCVCCGDVLFDSWVSIFRWLDILEFKKKVIYPSVRGDIVIFVSTNFPYSNSVVSHHICYSDDICVPVCASCHAKIHNSRLKFDDFKPVDKNVEV